MKKILVKTAIAGLLSMGLASCADDLNISSIDPQTSSTYEDMQLLAKIYSTMGLTGQKGPAGSGDISSDEGESGFYRTTFNLQEHPTDECNWAWQTDPDIPQLTSIGWNSSSPRVQWAYQRLGFNITLCNFYLTNTADRAEDTDYKMYRAEVRFLRALYYWYFLDLWNKAPFKDESYAVDQLPVCKGGKELYDWLDKELTDIEGELAPIGSFNDSKNFGRADQGAAYILHARLALNAEVYTNGAVKDYQKAVEYSDKVINSGKYTLASTPKVNPANGLTYSGYAQVFMADNDQNAEAMHEIILPIRQDGKSTKCYSGANYLVSSMRITGMPYMGTSNGWSCNYARPNLIQKFFPAENIPMSSEAAPDGATEEDIIALDAQDGSDTKSILAAAGDDRALFYAGRGGGIRKLHVEKMSNFLDGISIVKWQNIRTDGGTTNDVEFPDTDIPLLRYAEAFMTRAEAKWRLGDSEAAISDINVLRNRANATPITAINSEEDIIDEWCREFYMEGRRRSDLNRFDRFVGKKYIWDWKGGVAKGQTVDGHFKFYPIPIDDINGNENMVQNAGY